MEHVLVRRFVHFVYRMLYRKELDPSRFAYCTLENFPGRVAHRFEREVETRNITTLSELVLFRIPIATETPTPVTSSWNACMEGGVHMCRALTAGRWSGFHPERGDLGPFYGPCRRPKNKDRR